MENKKDDFISLAKQEKDHRLKLRYLALAHFQEGKSRYSIAKYLKISRTSVTKWISNYNKNGLEALNTKPYKGGAKKLSEQNLIQLQQFVSDRSKSASGGRLIGTQIQEYILHEFGVTYHLSQVYKILKQLNFSWITSRSKHPKQSPIAIEAFKKIPN